MSKLSIVWDGSTKGNGKVVGENAEIPIAIPTRLQGSGEGLNPKDLLTASAATCFYMTFKHLMEARKLPIIDFTMKTESSELKGNDLTITHYPTLVLSKEANEEDEASIKRAIESADRSCAVGNFLKESGAEILFETTFTKG